jgi:hypothetical protein
VTPGIYRHYKGNDYLVLTVARHSEREELLVIYMPLVSKDGTDITPWARPLEMFEEVVVVDGRKVPRFELITPLRPAAACSLLGKR